MRKVTLIGWSLILGIISFPSFATWQLADSYHGTRILQNWLPERLKTSDIPLQYASTNCTISFKKGWLKANIEHEANVHHWIVRWNAPENYHLLLDTKLDGPDFPSVMNQLLSHYPLKAKYNRSAQIMTVIPLKTK